MTGNERDLDNITQCFWNYYVNFRLVIKQCEGIWDTNGELFLPTSSIKTMETKRNVDFIQLTALS